MIYHLHADTTGTDSIQDIIDSGTITYIPIESIDQYDRVCHSLLPKVKQGDSVVLDTTSQMGATSRIDIRYGIDPEQLIYERYHSITTKKDQDNFGLYTNSANIIMRRLKNLYARGASIVTTVHEEERIDQADMRKKHNMGLNDEFRRMVEASASDIFRLSQLNEPFLDFDTGAVMLPKGTRILHIRRTEEINAKLQVPIAKDVELLRAGVEQIALPMGDGGWSKMCRVIGKEPRWLALYGLTGVGKTNFVLRRGPEPSVARIVTNERKEEAS